MWFSYEWKYFLSKFYKSHNSHAITTKLSIFIAIVKPHTYQLKYGLYGSHMSWNKSYNEDIKLFFRKILLITLSKSILSISWVYM